MLLIPWRWPACASESSPHRQTLLPCIPCSQPEGVQKNDEFPIFHRAHSPRPGRGGGRYGGSKCCPAARAGQQGPGGCRARGPGKRHRLPHCVRSLPGPQPVHPHDKAAQPLGVQGIWPRFHVVPLASGCRGAIQANGEDAPPQNPQAGSVVPTCAWALAQLCPNADAWLCFYRR